MKLQNTDRQPQIGDVYLMRFGRDRNGSEQKGYRPGLVFQNNTGNLYSPNIVALPLTSSVKKSNQVTHVIIPSEGTGLSRDSMVLCENPECISKDRLGNYITTIPDKYMSQIAIANLLASSAISFVSPEVLLSIWRKASALNTVS